ncbi:hypothetical protein GCM10007094_39220 [Pseudovibrio japonicus]|uniref:Uncharacterized protein n=2 Tax=Pseudovibrio japonicus TaxID=366534 RepID=A0ABQ3ELQ6_9HYPH|nr:hypothetical protein GCM10007094_39220 [Pseudovibrio japonicus]
MPPPSGKNANEPNLHERYNKIDEVAEALCGVHARLSPCSQALIYQMRNEYMTDETTNNHTTSPPRTIALKGYLDLSVDRTFVFPSENKVRILPLIELGYLELARSYLGYFDKKAIVYDWIMPQNHPCHACPSKTLGLPNKFSPMTAILYGRSCTVNLTSKRIHHNSMDHRTTFSPMIECDPTLIPASSILKK